MRITGKKTGMLIGAAVFYMVFMAAYVLLGGLFSGSARAGEILAAVSVCGIVSLFIMVRSLILDKTEESRIRKCGAYLFFFLIYLFAAVTVPMALTEDFTSRGFMAGLIAGEIVNTVLIVCVQVCERRYEKEEIR